MVMNKDRGKKMRIRDYLIMATLGVATLFGCSDDKKADTTRVRNYHETELLHRGEYFVVGNAPFARSLKLVSEDLANNRLTFEEKDGYTREISLWQHDGAYTGTLVCDGWPHDVRFDNGSLTVDADGDNIFEDEDTLDKLVCRPESKVVRPGQSFTYTDSQGEACMSYFGHSANKIFLRDQGYNDFEISIGARHDGALGGAVVIDGCLYSFALNSDSSIVVDRNGDSYLEGFSANGAPSYFNAASAALVEGSGDTLTLGSVQYFVEPFLIDEVNKTVRFVVNGEVTPAIAEGDTYQLRARPGELRLTEVTDTPYGNKANFCLRAD